MIHWHHLWYYVDIETGIRITKSEANQYYSKIKIKKHATYNNKQKGRNTVGFIEHTVECRRKPEQLTIFTKHRTNRKNTD